MALIAISATIVLLLVISLMDLDVSSSGTAIIGKPLNMPTFFDFPQRSAIRLPMGATKMDASVSVQSNEEGVVNPHPFKFLLLEKTVCLEKRKDVFLVIMVHSALENYKRRMLIRETWGSQRLYGLLKTVLIFAMGTTDSLQVQDYIDIVL